MDLAGTEEVAEVGDSSFSAPPDQPATTTARDLLQPILHAAVTYPGRPALSGHRGRPLRYRDLAVAIVATAKGLRRNGFEPGQRLLLALRPDPTAVVVALATVAAGGSVVLVDPRSGPDLFAARVAAAEPSWVAADPILYAAGFLHPLLAVTGRSGADLPDVRGLGLRTLRTGPWMPGVPAGTMSLHRLTAGRGHVDDEPLPGLREDPAAEAMVIFARGARAIVHTRGSLGAAMSMLAAGCEIGHRARIYTDHPLLGLPALAAGAHWRLPGSAIDGRVDPVRFAKSIGRATHIFLPPSDLSVVLTAMSAGLASTPPALQQVLLGWGAVRAPLVARTREILPNVRILAIYGKPEILPITIAEGPDKLATDPAGEPVGGLQPGLRARIAEDGELFVAGPNLARGYLGEPPLTEFGTGDLAVLRGDSVVLSGPGQNIIVRGKTGIDPAVTETAVEALPGVGHAALIGVWGEVGGMRVVLALQPAGQPVNDHPLASEPKQSNSRDDDTPAAAEVSVLLDHPLAAAVAAALPGVIDPAALPDQIVVLSAIPTDGGGEKTDRVALGRLLSALPLDEPESTPDVTGSGLRRAIARILVWRTARRPVRPAPESAR